MTEESESQRIFVGYDRNSPAYLVYYPNTRKVLKHRLVEFMTKSEVECSTQTDMAFVEDDNYGKRFLSLV